MVSFIKTSIFLSLFIAFISNAYTQVDTVRHYSQSLNKEMPYAITFPDSYNNNNDGYPVVYLLHGAGGDYSNWHKSVKNSGLLSQLANTYEVLIVTPEVGPYSYYYDSPLMDSVRYESYITNDLIKEIDGKYRTIADKSGRAITGLSMGGHGALMLGAKHPELFAAIGSMSGVTNIDTRLWDVDENRRSQRVNQQKEMLGAINYDAPYSTYTAVGLIDKMKDKGIKMIIDCGTEDFLVKVNRQFHKLLLEAGVEHDYIERPGAHNWEYWTNALPYHFLFFDNILSKKFAKNSLN
tara:strand:+ start:7421 stop:8302 length:882 start_codon:yes stop_codon:yes gene_type:complete